MARKVVDSIEDTEEKPATSVKRLCNEIQLFDLCELEKCGHKQGPYCTSPELLNRFEAIAEEDERRPAKGFDSEEPDDSEASDYDGDDDAYDDDRFGDEDYDEEE